MKFDEELWKRRAWDRHCKAVKSGKDARLATAKWTEDVRYSHGLRVVVEWCDARGLKVNFARRHGGIYYVGRKEILISSRASPKVQLHYLLHECGHHLIKPDKSGRYSMGYENSDPKAQNRINHRIDVVDEEFEAWHRGWKLALRLGIMESEEKEDYDVTRVKMLHSYLLWATKAKGYENS